MDESSVGRIEGIPPVWRLERDEHAEPQRIVHRVHPAGWMGCKLRQTLGLGVARGRSRGAADCCTLQILGRRFKCCNTRAALAQVLMPPCLPRCEAGQRLLTLAHAAREQVLVCGR